MKTVRIYTNIYIMDGSKTMSQRKTEVVVPMEHGYIDDVQIRVAEKSALNQMADRLRNFAALL